MSRFSETLGKIWQATKQRTVGIAAGGALFLLAFLVGIHLFFPVAAVQQWLTGAIHARASLTLQIEQLSVSPVFTLVGRQATVVFDNAAQPPIAIEEFRLKPYWRSLLAGDPGLTVNAALLQGQVDATIHRSGALALHAQGVQLKALPVGREAQVLVSGTIVDGLLQGTFPATKSSENHIRIELDNVSMTVAGQPLALGRLSVQGSGQGNTLRISTLTASGGDLTVTGNGTLLLGATAAASRISLDLNLRPAPAFAALFDLIARKQPDNSYRLRVNGSLASPALEPAAPAGRQAVEPAGE